MTMKNTKFKTSLVTRIKEDAAEEREQDKLREKFGIEKNKEVVLVPVKNLFESLIDKVIGAVKVFLIFLLLVMAAIGVLSLLYPETREILFQTFQGWQQEINMYLGVNF